MTIPSGRTIGNTRAGKYRQNTCFYRTGTQVEQRPFHSARTKSTKKHRSAHRNQTINPTNIFDTIQIVNVQIYQNFMHETLSPKQTNTITKPLRIQTANRRNIYDIRNTDDRRSDKMLLLSPLMAILGCSHYQYTTRWRHLDVLKSWNTTLRLVTLRCLVTHCVCLYWLVTLVILKLLWTVGWSKRYSDVWCLTVNC